MTQKTENETPTQRAEREAKQLKESRLPPVWAPSQEPIHWVEQGEGAKLHLLETKVNWWNVPKADHIAIIEREVDMYALPTMMVKAVILSAQWDQEQGLTATKPLEADRSAVARFQQILKGEIPPEQKVERQGEEKEKGREM